MNPSATAVERKPGREALVVFKLDAEEFALHISAVERVVRVVKITPLPNAPDGVSGVVNVQGAILPVFDVRSRLCRPPRKTRLSDHLIVAHTGTRRIAMVVDAVIGVVELDQREVIPAADILPHLKEIDGVVKLKGDIIFIENPGEFLRIEEEALLDLAMKT